MKERYGAPLLGLAKSIYYSYSDPPNITYTTPDQTVNETDTVPLNCTADGKPTPNITWTSPGGSKISFEPTCTLNITSKLDEGAYNCTADNGVGTPVAATVNITVQCELVVKACTQWVFSLQLVV